MNKMERLSDDELVALLHDVESDRAERKESLTDGDKVRQAVCAFANDLPNHRRPGVIFINAKDDGTPAKTPVDDRLLTSLGSMRSDGNILPIPTLTVEKRTLLGNDYAVVTVLPADAPPVRFKGTVWVRVGPQRAIASTQDERILNERRRHRDLPFDLQPIPSSSIKDFQTRLFEEEYLPSAFSPDVLAANGRTHEQRLAALRMVVTADEPVPTLLGILVLCSRVRDFVPGAYVQFLRIAGTELADPIVDEEAIDGPLAQMLRKLDEKLRAHVRTQVDLTSGPRESRAPDYPIAALEQLTRNAVLHRSYEGTNAPVRVTWFDDRIEVWSPGGPYGTVTRQNFGTAGLVDYRNPSLAEAMKTLGYIQRFGVGIATAKRVLADNGNSPPTWQVEDGYVLVTVKR
jgi:ATP-dependent DNA helicase RecG